LFSPAEIKELEKIIRDTVTDPAVVDSLVAAVRSRSTTRTGSGTIEEDINFYRELQTQMNATAESFDDFHRGLDAGRSHTMLQYREELRKLNEEYDPLTMSMEEYVRRAKEIEEATSDATDAIVQQEAASKNNVSKLKSLLKTMTGVSDGATSFVGNLFTLESGLMDLEKAVKDTFTPINILQSTIAKMEESTVDMVRRTDAAFASFNRVTAAGGSLNQVMFDAQYSAGAMGVTVEGAAAATGALVTQMSNFTNLGSDAQKELIQTTAGMEALGISSDTTAGLIDVAMNSLRMSQDEAKALSNDLAKLSIGLGRPPAELAEGFRNALPTLAAYGKGAIKVFKGLAAAAKATSISTQELMSIFGESMDTFEGSAQAAGGLNQLLGGNLVNSMELLYATEDERIQIVKQAMDVTGRNFDMLDKYEKKAIAAAVGITDMNTANKLFGTSSEQVDHYTNTLDAMGVSQEKVNEAMLAGQTLFQKFKAIIDGMAVMVMPIVNGLNAMLDAILGLNDEMGGHLIPGLAIVTTLMSGMMMKALKLGGILQRVFGAFKIIGSFLAKVFTPAFAIIAAKAIIITTILFGMYKALTKVGGPLDKIAARWEEFTKTESGQNLLIFIQLFGKAVMRVGGILVEVGELVGNMLGGTLFTMFDGVLQILQSIPTLLTDPITGAINMITGLVKLVLGPALGPVVAVLEKLEEYGIIGGGTATALMSSLDPVQANDVIMRPGEKPIMLNKDDIVLAGTNLLGEQATRNTGVVNNATYNTSNVSSTTQASAPSAPMKERDLVIQINGREIGRVAADYIRKEYSLVNNSGY